MKLAVFWALVWRVAVILSVPVLTLRRTFAASPLAELVATYPTELIFFGSILCLVLGSMLGTFYPVPEDVKKRPMSLGLKFLVSLTFGVIAFIYVLHIDKSLTLLNPVWVGGVAFIAPAIVEIVRAWLIKAVQSKIGT
ncbi:MAG: hypothetical protein VXW65_03595 [Pseudomonadota bacterium]|nr:hypothetical protein [Pseudomonadota bacterium]